MDLDYFPHFIKMFFPEACNDLSNDDINEIGTEFKKYLEKTFADKLDKLEEFWDIRPITIVPRMGHPLFQKGYHPVFVLHFTQFIELEKEKICQ